MVAIPVLVVEDDVKVAGFIQKGLEEEGYAVDVLHDGDDAGTQARMIDYDCVVLDLNLGDSDGIHELERRGLLDAALGRV